MHENLLVSVSVLLKTAYVHEKIKKKQNHKKKCDLGITKEIYFGSGGEGRWEDWEEWREGRVQLGCIV